MNSFGIGVKGQIGLHYEITQNLVVAPDHPAGIHEVEVRDCMVNLQNMGLQFPSGHYRQVLHLMHGSTVGYYT